MAHEKAMMTASEIVSRIIGLPPMAGAWLSKRPSRPG